TLTQIDPIAPAPLPHLFADRAGDAWRIRRGGNNARLAAILRNVEHQLGADRLLEFLALADRHHEAARSADHAVLVIDIEVLDIDRAGLRLLQHDWQAVDDNALGDDLVAHQGHQRPLIVGAVARDVDDAADAAKTVAVEQ